MITHHGCWVKIMGMLRGRYSDALAVELQRAGSYLCARAGPAQPYAVRPIESVSGVGVQPSGSPASRLGMIAGNRTQLVRRMAEASRASVAPRLEDGSSAALARVGRALIEASEALSLPTWGGGRDGARHRSRAMRLRLSARRLSFHSGLPYLCHSPPLHHSTRNSMWSVRRNEPHDCSIESLRVQSRHRVRRVLDRIARVVGQARLDLVQNCLIACRRRLCLQEQDGHIEPPGILA
jgi:hypothetical protein